MTSKFYKGDLVESRYTGTIVLVDDKESSAGFLFSGEAVYCKEGVSGVGHCSNDWPIESFKIIGHVPPEPTITPHKHCEVIKRWAEGYPIQLRTGSGLWIDCEVDKPNWYECVDYRVKPSKAVRLQEQIDKLLSEVESLTKEINSM